jgi:hypothetical protein
MRSPLWFVAFFAVTVVVGIVLGWQMDRRLGAHAATLPAPALTIPALQS